MPWIIRRPEHVCKMPDKMSKPVGSIWWCSRCRQAYLIIERPLVDGVGTMREWKEVGE